MLSSTRKYLTSFVPAVYSNCNIQPLALSCNKQGFIRKLCVSRASLLSRPEAEVITSNDTSDIHQRSSIEDTKHVYTRSKDAFSDSNTMREASDRWGLDVTEFASLVFPEGRSKIMEETKKLTAARISKGHIGERISKYERNTLRDQQAREVLGQRTNHRSLTRGRLSPNPHLHKDSKGMSEEEKEDSMPLWMKHKLAIKEKLLGKAWIPQKRISRQAMEEVRYLRKQFPEEWTTDKLAKHFNISSESVRRILRTDFQLSPERVAEQDEAKERMRKEKVAAALERLKTERHARWLEIKAERRQMRLSRNPPVEGRIKLGAPKRSIINE